MLEALLHSAPWWAWTGFHVLVFLMLALDLGVFNRKVHAPSFREAAVWSAVWIGLALLFNGAVFMGYFAPGDGTPYNATLKGTEWFTGYVLEKSLSVDNLFVFVMLFGAFKVRMEHQHRILYWGILGALIMRAVMILAGTALLNRFEWMIWVFGAFLVYTGLKMFFSKGEDQGDPARSPLARAFRRMLPFDPEGGHQRFTVKKDGKRFFTPMFLVLLVVEATDLVFAVDSIPAVLAVTRDPFTVYTSNIFAILGLRSLYFLLANMMNRFRHLKTGLAVILVYVGVKMCIAQWVHIPIGLSLSVIAAVLLVSVAASLRRAPAAAR